MTVNSHHPDYSANEDRWELVEDILENDAEDRIRVIDVNDGARSTQYREDAVLINFTALTLEGLAGLVNRRPPEVKIPKEVQYLIDDASIDNRPLNLLTLEYVKDVLAFSRVGVLVDFARSDSDLNTMEQDLRAKFITYPTRNIINWNTATVKGKLQLNLIVIHEPYNDLGTDGFSWVPKERWRVLRLKEGVYVQELYNDTGVIDTVTPKDYNGEVWEEIPFKFVSADASLCKIKKSALYDIAVLNLAHYKNSADYEESCHIVGQPSIFMATNYTQDELKAANPNGIKFGARAGFNLGPEGDAKILQVNPNNLVDNAMMRKEEQAAFIGARLIAPAGGRETAEGVRQRFGSSNSSLANLTENISTATEQLIYWAAKFMMKKPVLKNIKYKLNTHFFDEGTDPNLVAQAMVCVREQVIPKSSVQDYLKRTDFLPFDVSNEELDEEIEANPPLNDELLGGPVNDNPRQTDKTPNTPTKTSPKPVSNPGDKSK